MMTSERYNGVKINTDTISNPELFNLIQYTQERRDQNNQDLQRLLGIASLRGLVEVSDE